MLRADIWDNGGDRAVLLGYVYTEASGKTVGSNAKVRRIIDDLGWLWDRRAKPPRRATPADGDVFIAHLNDEFRGYPLGAHVRDSSEPPLPPVAYSWPKLENRHRVAMRFYAPCRAANPHGCWR